MTQSYLMQAGIPGIHKNSFIGFEVLKNGKTCGMDILSLKSSKLCTAILNIKSFFNLYRSSCHHLCNIKWRHKYYCFGYQSYPLISSQSNNFWEYYIDYSKIKCCIVFVITCLISIHSCVYESWSAPLIDITVAGGNKLTSQMLG